MWYVCCHAFPLKAPDAFYHQFLESFSLRTPFPDSPFLPDSVSLFTDLSFSCWPPSFCRQPSLVDHTFLIEFIPSFSSCLDPPYVIDPNTNLELFDFLCADPVSPATLGTSAPMGPTFHQQLKISSSESVPQPAPVSFLSSALPL